MTPMPFAAPFARALLRSQSDERLVRLAREGQQGAFDEIVRRYRAPLVAFAAAYATAEKAEDVVQESLTNAWVSLAIFGARDRAQAVALRHRQEPSAERPARRALPRAARRNDRRGSPARGDRARARRAEPRRRSGRRASRRPAQGPRRQCHRRPHARSDRRGARDHPRLCARDDPSGPRGGPKRRRLRRSVPGGRLGAVRAALPREAWPRARSPAARLLRRERPSLR